MADLGALVSTEWLDANRGAPDLRVLDASWYLPDQQRDSRAEYEAAHIPGARFVDLDSVSDSESDLPHMAPGTEAFAARLGALGVGSGDRVVVYDGAGLFSVARIWWLLRTMGGVEASVLDGGLPKWREEGRPVESGWPEATAGGRAVVSAGRGAFADAEAVAAATRSGAREVVDARPDIRYRGATPEPRPGLGAGHIPGSHNLPFTELLNADATMKAPEELRALFERAGVDLSKPVITSCGSGVTAAILNLALVRMGREADTLYDGSWSEWGRFDESWIAQG